MRVLFMAGRELAYPRNDVLLRAFRRFAQVEVVEVRQRSSSLLINSLRIGLKSLPRLITGRFDLIFVGFYGHLLMLPVSALARAPILFDAFVSTFDTLAGDRQLVSTSSLLGKAALWLDRYTCWRADHILLDTDFQAEFFVQNFALPTAKVSAIPVGCNEDLFRPRPYNPAGEPTRVLYYSSYLPLHGVETVVRAAAHLKSEAISFRMIGKGQTYAAVRRLADEYSLSQVEFVPPVPLDALADELGQADIALGGHFGTSDKAGRVVPGKIYQILAVGRPLIAAASPANLACLTHRQSAYLCPPGDAEALADAILTLHRDPDLRRMLALNGRALFETRFSESVITKQLHRIVMGLLSGGNRSSGE